MYPENGTATDRSGTVGSNGANGIHPARTGSTHLTAGPPPAEMARRIHYLLHRGCVQIRNLSQNATTDHRRQIEDLADILEIVPKYLESWDDGSLDNLKQLFARYEAKYPSETTYPFSPFLGEFPVHRWY